MSSESILGHFEDWDYLQQLKNTHYSHLSCHQIRRASWERSGQEVALAENENRPVLISEWKAGMRKEELEWEVREAVQTLWLKGYTTYYSGYEGSDGLQVIRFVSLESPRKEALKRIWQLTDESGILTWSTGTSQLDKDELCQTFNSGKPV